MRSISIAFLVVAVLLAAGCLEEKPSSPASAGQTSVSTLTVKITSPRAGDILGASSDATFAAAASGGNRPYSYRWTSNLNGVLGSGESLRLRSGQLKKGAHTIIVQAEDSGGKRAQGSIQIRVI